MDNGNGTAFRQYRFLDEGYFDELYRTFTEAFSDYVIPFALTEQQFKNHLNLTGVDLRRTVGCLSDGKLIGFSLNGFGYWKGKPTAYDAGTGVIPSARRQGISEEMFEMMLPQLRQSGVEQVLLEVITTNSNAIALYEKFDFKKGRLLALLQCDGSMTISKTQTEYPIREIKPHELPEISHFWDAEPAWQNSLDAIARSNKLKRVAAAFDGERCVGYVIFSIKFGRIAQIAVAPEYRRRGIATSLLATVQQETAPGFSIQVINIDTELENAMAFFKSLGFYERINQHEMTKTL